MAAITAVEPHQSLAGIAELAGGAWDDVVMVTLYQGGVVVGETLEAVAPANTASELRAAYEPPTDGWPPGEYRLTVSLAESAAHAEFRVSGPTP